MKGTLANALAGGIVLGVAAGALGADEDLKSEVEALKQKVNQQQEQIQQLRSENSESWLNERRKEQVKGLVQDVLNDADTRASFQGEGLNAGYEDHFFISSGDGNFLLQVTGHSQTRYIYNNSDQVNIDTNGAAAGGQTTQREHEEGFQQRRARFGFFGHVYDPAITYGLSFRHDEGDRGFGSRTVTAGGTTFQIGTGDVNLENAFLGYEFADGWQFKAGQFKAPFLREESVDSSKQLAIERSVVADLYTVDYTQGAQLSFTGNMVRLQGMIHDGSYAANTDFVSGQEADFAVAGRAEALLAGNWQQFEDFATFSGDSLGVMAGAAVDWELAEGETNTTGNDVLKWTADLSVEVPEAYGFNAFGALIGNHINGDNDQANVTNADQLGVVAQTGVFIVPDKLDAFIRWEFVDLDGASLGGTPLDQRASDEIHALTFGSNYYIKQHTAKLSTDLVWYLEQTGAPTNPAGGFGVPNPAPIGRNTGAGIVSTPSDDQFALRAQLQFLF